MEVVVKRVYMCQSVMEVSEGYDGCYESFFGPKTNITAHSSININTTTTTTTISAHTTKTVVKTNCSPAQFVLVIILNKEAEKEP